MVSPIPAFLLIFLVYDVTARSSFQKLDMWLGEVDAYANRPGMVSWSCRCDPDSLQTLSDIIAHIISMISRATKECFSSTFKVKMLVANKIDNKKERVITRDDGLKFARKHSTLFIECSARTADGVATAFEELVEKVGLFFLLWKINSI